MGQRQEQIYSVHSSHVGCCTHEPKAFSEADSALWRLGHPELPLANLKYGFQQSVVLVILHGVKSYASQSVCSVGHLATLA
jgi:hypothetical protein